VRAILRQLEGKAVHVIASVARMGHSSPTVTLNVYGHLFASTADRAAQITEDTFVAVRSE
jgi:acyl-CoA hydrolase